MKHSQFFYYYEAMLSRPWFRVKTQGGAFEIFMADDQPAWRISGAP